MSDQIILYPKITDAGRNAAINADNLGVKVKLAYVGFGTGQYNPTGSEVALFNELARVPATGAMKPAPNQLRLTGAWQDNVIDSEIGEIGFFTDDGVLFAVWSRASGGPLGYKTAGVDFVIFTDLAFDGIPEGSIEVIVNPDANDALSALAQHEVAGNPHSQYLRVDRAVDDQSLRFSVAAGTANEITLDLPPEVIFAGPQLGQEINFVAGITNTGPVTVSVNSSSAVPVTKVGSVPLYAGDIRAGAVYTLIHDGTNYQLSGGVGGGDSGSSVVIADRYEFDAAEGQDVFPLTYTGDPTVYVNGRFLAPSEFEATDGLSIVLEEPLTAGDKLVVMDFHEVAIADVWTRAQADARYMQHGDAFTKTESDARYQQISLLPDDNDVGMISYFARSTAPNGYLKANGALVSRTTYADLFSVIGVTYGAGDGSTTFRLPDLRAEFIRGWDDGRGVDSGRVLGSTQAQQVGKHKHVVAWGTHLTSAFGQTLNRWRFGSGEEDSDNYWHYTNDGTNYDGAVNAPGVIGDENRPRNIAMLACIRYRP